jgi:Flp pilus assembly pilin Flp
MKSKDKLRRFWRDERGQSTTEYILILAVVVMIASKFRETFQKKLIGIVERLGGEIEKASDPNS